MKDLRRSSTRALLALESSLMLASASVSACGGTAQTGGEETGSSEESGSGDPGVLVGSFVLQVNEATNTGVGTTTFIGKVYDGPSPSTVVWEPGTKDGECQLFTPRVPFCNTPCGGSAACVEDDVCQAYPTALDVGEVTVTGVATVDGDSSFTMQMIAGNYQPRVSLAYPAVAAGDPVALAAAGNEVDAFDIAAAGIDQLGLDNDTIPVSRDADIQLTWTAAPEAATSEIHVKLDISHHAGSKGKIECETTDSGALTLTAALVGELLDLGVAGFPTIIVTRSTTASSTMSAGRVDLVVSSSIERAVTIEGLTSCTHDDECPEGQTCHPDLRCA